MGRKSNAEKLVESQLDQIDQEISQLKTAIIKAETSIRNLNAERDRLILLQNELTGSRKGGKDE